MDVSFSTPSLFRVLNNVDPQLAGGPTVFLPFFSKPQPVPSHHLCTISSQYLMQIHISSSWHTAYITEIFEKGDSFNPDSYRPTSITSSTWKVMERVIKVELCSALDFNGRISFQQHAFNTKHSATINKLETTFDLSVLLNSNPAIDVIYIDF